MIAIKDIHKLKIDVEKLKLDDSMFPIQCYKKECHPGKEHTFQTQERPDNKGVIYQLIVAYCKSCGVRTDSKTRQ